MRTAIFGAALAALLGGILAPIARADILDLSDGKTRLPKSVKSPWGTPPSDQELQDSGKRNLDLSYDSYKLSGASGDAAAVAAFWLTDTIANQRFNEGERNGQNAFWPEAAQAFGAASEELQGLAKEQALYKRMLSLANTGDQAATLKAADDLLAANPKTYYFGPAQETRARIFALRGKLADALAALKLVSDIQNMNVRDNFSAMYLATLLSKSLGADSPKKWAAAEDAYRSLLTDLVRAPHHELAEVPRFRILMSLGEALRNQNKADEAKKQYEQILDEASTATDKGVLAGVYTGLGDLAFTEASQLQANAAGSKTAHEKVRELLDQAALHYLRVTLLYKDFAQQRDLFGATRGVARVFNTVFKLTGEKDCDLAHRAYEFYRRAVDMLESGEEKRLLIKEGLALKQRIDEGCSPEAGTTSAPSTTDGN